MSISIRQQHVERTLGEYLERFHRLSTLADDAKRRGEDTTARELELGTLYRAITSMRRELREDFNG
jgi:hypothetical protein